MALDAPATNSYGVEVNALVTPGRPNVASVVCDTANTDYDSSPSVNVLLLMTAGSKGARVTNLSAIPRATVTATQLQLFLSTDAGTTKVLIDSALMAAYTMAQTTEVPTTSFGYSENAPLVPGANARLYVGIGVTLAGGIAFRAEWGDY
jgi:hypothetical protein